MHDLPVGIILQINSCEAIHVFKSCRQRLQFMVKKERIKMAKFETTVNGDFNAIIKRVETEIINGSFTASLEESSDFCSGDARCSVRVFERYSYSGSNRVSLSVTFFQNNNDEILVSAITSGGSQGAFFKLNTFGEEAFLDKIKEVLR